MLSSLSSLSIAASVLPMNSQAGLLRDVLAGSPCSPRGSQEPLHSTDCGEHRQHRYFGPFLSFILEKKTKLV